MTSITGKASTQSFMHAALDAHLEQPECYSGALEIFRGQHTLDVIDVAVAAQPLVGHKDINVHDLRMFREQD